ncbi:MAG TPA: hypothetical protein VK607_18200, partial [Kofleriaceae bacterium]|nr:hypothetical protein [Kofleriaceae bacterium]
MIAMVLVARRAQAPGSGASGGARGSGAALRAPEGPQLSGNADNGVRLTGFVVDGAGLPVAGAEVSAEPERGAVDRALAPPRAAAGAAGSAAASRDAGAGAGSATGSAPGAVTGSRAGVIVALPTGPDGRFALAGLTPGRV